MEHYSFYRGGIEYNIDRTPTTEITNKDELIDNIYLQRLKKASKTNLMLVVIGSILSFGIGAALSIYGLVLLALEAVSLPYTFVVLVSGFILVVLGSVCLGYDDSTKCLREIEEEYLLLTKSAERQRKQGLKQIERERIEKYSPVAKSILQIAKDTNNKNKNKKLKQIVDILYNNDNNN